MNDEVRLAEAEVARRRDRVMASARELQARLEPRTLLRGAWQNAKVKGADLAEDAVDAVRARPYAIGGALAALALFLARDPIRDTAAELVDKAKASEEQVLRTLIENDCGQQARAWVQAGLGAP